MIEIKNIDFAYKKKQNLFSELSLTMTQGHIYGLLGKNGTGKTSLLKIISGLLFAQKGEVNVLGYNAASRKPDMLNDLYFLPEEIFVPYLKIKQIEKVYAPFYPKFSKEQFDNYLKEFEIQDKNALVNKLSQGQKKKVMIAFALACNTKLLLLDEPTNGLDIPSKSIFRRVMASVATEDIAIIISTHQVRDLHSLIDSVIILDNGEIIINETDEYITQKLTFNVLETPVNETTFLYAEDNFRGLAIVKENDEHIETKLDLELFFNAVMANKSKMKDVFNLKNE
ncbi:MAG: ABC transporter ATP-binding protein [Bacteroidales bacterium]|nr:ABC transporter ATP-binding protein [Bacteroidales bacterium]MDD4208731.1 ABC transporter ATP-binding protein [Bacteroidales bacterium]